MAQENCKKVACALLEKSRTSVIIEKIENLLKEHIDKFNAEPSFAGCCIKFLDDSSFENVDIKLSSGVDTQDDSTFYYCNSIAGLKSLCEEGVDDFVIVDVYCFHASLS